jgi:hypothetical protein
MEIGRDICLKIDEWFERFGKRLEKEEREYKFLR